MLAPRRALTLITLLLCASGGLAAQEAPEARPESSLGERRMNLPARRSKHGFHGHDRADLRADWNQYFFGGAPTVEYLDFKARAAAEELGKVGAARFMPGIPNNGATWVNLGPRSNLTSGSFPDIDSGRLVAILTHPTDPNTVYVVPAGSGVFKCVNADLNAAGAWTWTSMTDALPASSGSGNVSVGALAMDPSNPNTLFIGLGDLDAIRTVSPGAAGRGFYKSTDGGATWGPATLLGSTTAVGSILTVSSSVVLVGGNAGLWRSVDGGATFTNISLGGNFGGTIWSLQKLSATDLILSRDSGSAGSIWYSNDAGATWTQGAISGLTVSRRITVASSAASASTAWGIAEISGSSVAPGLLKTTDKGATWTYIPAPSTPGSLFKGTGNQMSGDGGQSYYNQFISVDPTNINRVFVGANLALYRTEDGGLSWSQLTHWYANRHVYAHADFHTSAWSKTGPSTLFIGNDGGLSILRTPAVASGSIPTGSGSVNSVVSFLDNRRNRDLASHEVYNLGSTIAASPADSRYRITLGLQDNGTRVRQDEGSGLQASSTFEDMIGGDGFGTVIHPNNGNLMLGSIYYTAVCRSANGGSSAFNFSVDGSGNPITIGIPESGDGSAAPFAPTFALGSNSTPDTVYTWVFKVIYKSPDFGLSWSAMPMNGFNTALNIRNIAAAASNPSAVACVTSSGTGYVTYNAGSTWTQFGTIPNNGASMSYVWFDTSNASTLYAASVAQFSTNSHLWKSTNSGATWTAIDGAGAGFPFGIPVYVVKNDPTNPSTVLAGTDFGVYSSTDGGSSWSRYGQGMPMVAVRDLYIAPDGSFVRAATFGRGVWEISGSSGPAAPTLASFNPASGPVSTPVTLTGTNFTGATSVKFNGTAATFNVDSATQISTSVPSGATTGTISVTTPGGTATSASAFTVGTITQPPAITSFTAAPAAILAGDSSTLSWVVSNATGLSISGIGAVTGSSVSVSPALTTTYTLTASNGLGNATATATVTVKTRDLDGSGGSPDVLDMAVLSRAYSGSGIPTSIPAADLDGDGDVDDNDIALFLAGL